MNLFEQAENVFLSVCFNTWGQKRVCKAQYLWNRL